MPFTEQGKLHYQLKVGQNHLKAVTHENTIVDVVLALGDASSSSALQEKQQNYRYHKNDIVIKIIG